MAVWSTTYALPGGLRQSSGYVVTLQAGDQTFGRFANMLGALAADKQRVAESRAINRAARTAYTHVVRALVAQTSAPRKLVMKQVELRLSAQQGDAPLDAVIYGRGSELPLSAFSPKQFSFGVRVKVWGHMQTERGAFMLSGHWRNKGNFIVPSESNPGFGRVFVRNGRLNSVSGRNNAISQLYGPSLPKEMVKDATLETFLRIAPVELEKRLQHELSRMLKI